MPGESDWWAKASVENLMKLSIYSTYIHLYSTYAVCKICTGRISEISWDCPFKITRQFMFDRDRSFICSYFRAAVSYITIYLLEYHTRTYACILPVGSKFTFFHFLFHITASHVPKAFGYCTVCYKKSFTSDAPLHLIRTALHVHKWLPCCTVSFNNNFKVKSKFDC